MSTPIESRAPWTVKQMEEFARVCGWREFYARHAADDELFKRLVAEGRGTARTVLTSEPGALRPEWTPRFRMSDVWIYDLAAERRERQALEAA